MAMDIDAALRRLSADDHPGLLGIGEGVIRRIHDRRQSEAAFGPRFLAVAAIVAMAFGTGAGSLPTQQDAASTLSPFGASNPLAPSTLLLADQ